MFVNIAINFTFTKFKLFSFVDIVGNVKIQLYVEVIVEGGVALDYITLSGIPNYSSSPYLQSLGGQNIRNICMIVHVQYTVSVFWDSSL